MMRWLKTSPWPACVLSAAAASTLINPFQLAAQTAPAVRPTSPRPVVTAPAQPLLAEADQAGESAVQKELRRMYEESGREMPQLQQQTRTQRPQPIHHTNTQPPAQVVPSTAQAPNSSPAAGNPAARPPSRNPLTNFFRRIVPGSQSRPAAPAIPPTPPAPPAVVESVPMVQPLAPTTNSPAPAPAASVVAQPSYAPYSGQQPRRLENSEPVTAAAPVATAPVALPLPPAPAGGFAPPTTPQTAAVPAAPSAPMAVASPGAATPARTPAARPTNDDFRPFDDEEFAPPVVAERVPQTPAVAPSDPEFAPPVVLDQSMAPALSGGAARQVESAPTTTAVRSAPVAATTAAPLPVNAPLEAVRLPAPSAPVAMVPAATVPGPAATEFTGESPAAIVDTPQAVAMTERQAPVTLDDSASFPDPFPEMSEEEADDEFESDLATPFVGIPLEEEFAEVAKSTTTRSPVAPLPDDYDPFAETQVAPAPGQPAPLPLDSTDTSMAGAPSLPLPTAAMTPTNSAPQTIPADDLELPSLPSPATVTELRVAEVPQALPLPDGPANPSESSAPQALSENDNSAPKLPAASLMPETAPDRTAPSLAENVDQSAPKLAVPAAPMAPINVPPTVYSPDESTAAKMAMIRDRGGMKGLKGFCPVTLRDGRELLDARPEFSATFRGQKFHFATEQAQRAFEKEPTRYVPAAYGADVVVLIRDKDVAEGSLDFAAWYKGQLYLFSSEANHNTFVAEPATYLAPINLE